VVIDYREAPRAIAAQKLLAGAGIVAVYTQDKWVAVSDDPTMTMWLVQRLQIPVTDASRALAMLQQYGLWDGPLGSEQK